MLLAPFSQDVLDRSTTDEKKTVHTAVLFALCFYHSPSSAARNSASVSALALDPVSVTAAATPSTWATSPTALRLFNYLEGNDNVPWEDLRYMFGEVFYGGHITDAMDRRLCISYLDVLVTPIFFRVRMARP